MKGMDQNSGHAIAGQIHLEQSITRLLTTPVGSRIMLRDYGSMIPELIDAPINAATTLQLHSTVVEALLRWEPRIVPQRISSHQDTTDTGVVVLSLEALSIEDIGNIKAGDTINLQIPLVAA